MLHLQAFTVNPILEHPYLLWDDSLEAVLIDPGFDTDRSQEQLVSFVERKGLRLVRCLLTHAHFDHILGAAFVSERWQIPIEASPEEIGSLPSLSVQLAAFGMPQPDRLSEPELIPFRDSPVCFGETTLRILPTPGHTAGGVSFYAADAAFLFTGDTLFAGGYGRTDLWGRSEAMLLHSITEQLLPLPEETKVYPGHGPFTTIGREKPNYL